jgi:hypothetical protein
MGRSYTITAATPIRQGGGMGYAGKFVERERARQLRAQSWTLQEIATELGVAKGSVSVWVRDVEFTPKPRNRGHAGCKPHPLKLRKQAEIEAIRLEAESWLAAMTDRDLTMYCLGLYMGEGSKTPGTVSMANTNPVVLRTFVTWLRRAFSIDEARMRAKLYLHEDLDLRAATEFWSRTLDIPLTQFTKPYRAVADPTRRSAKHVMGCATVIYASTSTHRRVMAMIEAIALRFANPG